MGVIRRVNTTWAGSLNTWPHPGVILQDHCPTFAWHWDKHFPTMFGLCLIPQIPGEQHFHHVVVTRNNAHQKILIVQGDMMSYWKIQKLSQDIMPTRKSWLCQAKRDMMSYWKIQKLQVSPGQKFQRLDLIVKGFISWQGQGTEIIEMIICKEFWYVLKSQNCNHSNWNVR